MGETTVSDALVARLEALSARLDEQAAEIAGLKAENVRLKAATATPPPARRSTGVTTRRGAVRRLLAAGAAATVASVARAEPAHAGTRTTLFADAGQSYGAAVTYPSGTDPTGFLPSLTGRTVGLIASSVNTAQAPSDDTMICGTANTLMGVYGLSRSNTGVRGHSENGVGVQGTSTNSHAVQGTSSYAGGYGTYGTSPYIGAAGTGNYAGVYGISGANGGIGVLGSAPAGVGFYAASAGAGTGLYAVSTSGYAAIFQGRVLVGGDFGVTGAKNALVPHPDGTHRRLYSEESTESWFSDYGEAQLVGGRAQVALDRDFAAVVQNDRYHVFLTPKGDTNGLYVASQSPTGFEVRETKGGVGSFGFSYRVVAKRKDIAAPRMERVTLPPPPATPALTEPPALPPDLPRAPVGPPERGR